MAAYHVQEDLPFGHCGKTAVWDIPVHRSQNTPHNAEYNPPASNKDVCFEKQIYLSVGWMTNKEVSSWSCEQHPVLLSWYCFNTLISQSTHLSYFNIVRMLEGGGQLLPGWGHGFAVTAPWSKKLDEMRPWAEVTEERKVNDFQHLIWNNI